MIVGLKDGAKLLGISIIACCAVFVCTMFLNFNIDIAGVEAQITEEPVRLFYEAQVSSGKVISTVSGGCLLLTSVIMLLFYSKHYIDTHKKELGILKALGYSNLRIARGFWVFGLSVFLGTAAGFAASFLLMPTFYGLQNEDKILPDFSVQFHPELALYLVLLPTALFALLAVLYAWGKLNAPVLGLLREQEQVKGKRVKEQRGKEQPFLQELRSNTLRSRKSLVFFIAFASFCFSSMMQMSFSVNALSSVMFTVMVVLIGIVLSCTTLLLAVTAVIRGNRKTIAMMRVFGYHQEECTGALLGGYRITAYIGFAVGTVYQYALLKTMVSVVFQDIENVPDYNFDVQALVICLVAFLFIYELAMRYCAKRIQAVSVKDIMLG